MSWDRVIGQAHIKDLLRRTIEQQRIAHAYLFTGSEGVGKFAAALQFAAALNCSVKPSEGCGQCSSCRRAEALHHPNIRLIFPLPVGKGEKAGDDPLQTLSEEQIAAVREEIALKAQNPYHLIQVPKATGIKINSIRAIRREASLTQAEGGTKVFIIITAERMNAEAANSLLKTLEEPPAHTVLILTSVQKEKLPATIVSRCQVLAFPLLREGELTAALVERDGASPEEAALAARLGNGSYVAAREALSMDMASLRADVVQFLRRALGRQRVPLALEIERIVAERDRPDAERWLRSLQIWLRDALLLASEGERSVPPLLHEEDLRSFVSKFPRADLIAAAGAVEDSIALVNKNAYLPLIFTNLALRLRNHLQGTPAAE